MTIDRLLIGTYTPKPAEHGAGASRGIYHATFDDATGQFNVEGLAAETSSPAFLAQAGEFVYAVNEQEKGQVSAFCLREDGLEFVNAVPTGGVYPCHLAMSADWLAVANYGSGNLATFDISDGALGDRIDFAQHTGSGPNPQRQTRAHAHQTYLTSAGMLVPDLGSDRLYRYRVDAKGTFVGEPSVTQFAPGAGPRHVESHPTLPILYLINELGNTINVLGGDAGALTVQQSVSTLPEDFEGKSTTAEIAVSADGRFVYGSNRGHDSIVSFAVDDTGRLSEPRHVSTGGSHPRHFAIDPSDQWLLVANQNSNNVVVFALQNGRPTDVVCESSAPKPVCLHFLSAR